MKIVILVILFISNLYSSYIKEEKISLLNENKNKKLLESDLLETSWINPVYITSDYTKDDDEANLEYTTKDISINLKQDIFKSGGISHTITKAKLQKKLAFSEYNLELNKLNNNIFKLVLQLNKTDLRIKKQNYLIQNKLIEIDKKEDFYLNSLINIEELDKIIIEKNELLNKKEDLKILKNNYLNKLNKLTLINYKHIEVLPLKILTIGDFLKSNNKIIIQTLKRKILKQDLKIVASNYLPKVSLFSNVGRRDINYKDDQYSNQEGNYYKYGIKLSIPLDYNIKKNKELSKIKHAIQQKKENLTQDNEINKYKKSTFQLNIINNKIKNIKKTYKHYENIYNLTQKMVNGFLKTNQDLKIISNTLQFYKLETEILNIDKQIIIYTLYES